MIVDFHTHVFPDKIAGKTIEKLEELSGSKAYTDGTVNSLLESMEKNNIDISVVLPVVTRPEQFKTINQFASVINSSNYASKRIISFGGIHPETLDYRSELKEIVSMGFKGIKLHPDYQMTMIDDIKYMHIVDYASELDLIVSVHAGVDVGFPTQVHCTPDRVLKLIKEVQPPKLVLAHMGGWNMWNEVRKYLIGENVYLDTAYIDNSLPCKDFKEMVNKHDLNKILFATDSPWSGHKELIEYIMEAGFEKDILEKILYKNALSLLKV